MYRLPWQYLEDDFYDDDDEMKKGLLAAKAS